MTTLTGLLKVLDTAETLANISNGGAPLTVEAAPEVWGLVEEAKLSVQSTEKKIDAIDAALRECSLDYEIAIQEEVRETGAYTQFTACPFTKEQQENTVFIGQGCDGVDNNCNSVITSTNTAERVVSIRYYSFYI